MATTVAQSLDCRRMLSRSMLCLVWMSVRAARLLATDSPVASRALSRASAEDWLVSTVPKRRLISPSSFSTAAMVSDDVSAGLASAGLASTGLPSAGLASDSGCAGGSAFSRTSSLLTLIFRVLSSAGLVSGLACSRISEGIDARSVAMVFFSSLMLFLHCLVVDAAERTRFLSMVLCQTTPTI